MALGEHRDAFIQRLTRCILLGNKRSTRSYAHQSLQCRLNGRYRIIANYLVGILREQVYHLRWIKTFPRLGHQSPLHGFRDPNVVQFIHQLGKVCIVSPVNVRRVNRLQKPYGFCDRVNFPINLGLLFQKRFQFGPSTPKGIHDA